MVAYAVGDTSDHVFDPAVGAGAFFRAAKAHGYGTGTTLRLMGCEIDQAALNEALTTGLIEEDLSGVAMSDFLLHPPSVRPHSIVANPPYIRHHRLSSSLKQEMRCLCQRLLGRSLDARAGSHVYFLVRALEILADGGRLAFILPADTCEGVFANTLWSWIALNYRVDAVVTFTPDATPFPGVDTNPMIVLIQKSRPRAEFCWARCAVSQTDDLTRCIASGFSDDRNGAISVHIRSIAEGLKTGMSRPPMEEGMDTGPTLGDFARVMRGIATGENSFFFLTKQRAQELGIPPEFLTPAIGRTRDVQGSCITDETITDLERRDRPTLLLSVNGQPFESLPETLRDYIRAGEEEGFHRKALISTRRPWYKMECRSVPPLLFAYLGRRNARFILNTAGVLPLTGFLCVYPRIDSPLLVKKLYQVLQHPQTVAGLALVGKSYGSGAVKVEPRALERLPLPRSAVEEAGLWDFRLGEQLGFVMEKRADYSVSPESI